MLSTQSSAHTGTFLMQVKMKIRSASIFPLRLMVLKRVRRIREKRIGQEVRKGDRRDEREGEDWG
jgi:hypothetical protein